ncbi:MAG: ATP-binding protein [Candidatus Nitrospinota bacterium M3_3B_026]
MTSSLTPSGFEQYRKIVSRLNKSCSENEFAGALGEVLREFLGLPGFSGGGIRIGLRSGRAGLDISREEGARFCFTGLSAPGCVCGAALAGGSPGRAASGKTSLPHCTGAGFRHAVAAPVIVDGEAGGIFFAAVGDAAPPDPESLLIVEAMAANIGETAARILENKTVEARAQDLETVNTVGRLIASKLTLKDMTREIVARLGTVMETDEVNVVVYDDARKELSFLASYFAAGSGLDRPEVYPLSDGMNSWVVKNRKPLLMKYDTVEECEKLGIRHGGRPAKSWLGAPMIYQDRVVGVVSVQSYTKKGLYGERSAELLEAVARQCAVAVENSRLFEEVVAREEEKELLYFSLTHDLLSLLNPVSGYARLLKSVSPTADPESFYTMVDNLSNSTERTARFVEDILVYAKIKSGKLVLNVEEGDIMKVVESAVQASLPELAMRRIDVFVNGAHLSGGRAQVPGSVLARFDRAQLERVFLNLVGNALKHARSRIDIDARAEGEDVFLRVSDDGQGVAEEQLESLFEEYHQGGHRKKGVGLGLPTVRKIIGLHGGSIKAVSGLGRGFALEFSWPRGLSSAPGTMEG